MAKKLYVGNLPYEYTNEKLAELFYPAGEVESANVIVDRDSGRSKGFGFVEMKTEEEAQKAIEKFDGFDLDGRTIKVNEAKPMEKRDDRRGGSGGSFNRSGGSFDRPRGDRPPFKRRSY